MGRRLPVGSPLIGLAAATSSGSASPSRDAMGRRLRLHAGRRCCPPESLPSGVGTPARTATSCHLAARRRRTIEATMSRLATGVQLRPIDLTDVHDLAVDDHDDTLEFFGVALQQFGANILKARTARDALASLRTVRV